MPDAAEAQARKMRLSREQLETGRNSGFLVAVRPGFQAAESSDPDVQVARCEGQRRCGTANLRLRYPNVSTSVSLSSGLQPRCVRARGDMRSRLRLPGSVHMLQRYKASHRPLETSKAY